MTDFSARALVVDDEAISRKMVKFALEREGFQCDCASDGIEAMSKIESSDYEVVITDLKMPNKHGGDLVVELLGQNNPPLVVVHTSVLEPEVARGLIDEGVDDIVFKPVDYAAFAGKTRALLNRRRAPQKQNRTRFPGNSMGSSGSGISRAEFSELISNVGKAEKGIDQVGQYRLIRKLGEGGMGQVYEAEHSLLHRRCAVKLILPEFTSNRIALSRFEREVQAMARLSHWNTVRIFDYGVDARGCFFYAMELLDGLTLEQLISRDGPLPPNQAIHILNQVCDALEEAHQTGLVHRDLKPSNLMVANVGGQANVAKVVDFGLVRATEETSVEATLVTHLGGICGTPKYIAPEQAMNPSSVDRRADIYSMGATAYYVLTGVPPFVRDSVFALTMAHVNDPVTPPSTHNPKLSQRIDEVILKCMAKAPKDRYQNMRELRSAFESCLD
ncbi:MAG: protein kinase [Planctomycetaceae bacterium]